MIWIKDIWFCFLKESDEYGYIDLLNDEIIIRKETYNDLPDSIIAIPRIFSRIGLLREYIRGLCYDKKLKKLEQELSDSQLQDLYHGKYACNYDENNEYSKWVLYGKQIIFDYAESWCHEQGIKCTVKDFDKLSRIICLDCL